MGVGRWAGLYNPLNYLKSYQGEYFAARQGRLTCYNAANYHYWLFYVVKYQNCPH